MVAVFLAGGFGTRISKVLPNVPKCLAPLISGGAFLDLMAIRLKEAGVKKFIFLTHHLSEQIQTHVSTTYFGVPAGVIRESIPLGTGGGLIEALGTIQGKHFIVLNADTYLECDIKVFISRLPPSNGIKLAAVKVPCASRFGRVQIQPNGLVDSFLEKTTEGESCGFINAGLYWVDRGFAADFAKGRPYSLEKDIFPKLSASCRLEAWKTEAKFLDIGTPEDLALAQAGLKVSSKA